MTGRIRSLLAALAEKPPPAVEAARTQALADAVFKLEEIREWAEGIRERDQRGPCPDDDRWYGTRTAAAEVLRILDAP